MQEAPPTLQWAPMALQPQLANTAGLGVLLTTKVDTVWASQLRGRSTVPEPALM